MLRRVQWFSDVPDAVLRRVCADSRRFRVPRYTDIVREACFGSSFYLLLEGQVCVVSERQGLNLHLSAGASFGEAALITQERRAATVTAVEPCALLLSEGGMALRRRIGSDGALRCSPRQRTHTHAPPLYHSLSLCAHARARACRVGQEARWLNPKP